MTPGQRADDALRDILRTQFERVPAVRVDSPPGAGKTGLVERLAAQSLGILGERCLIATQTNEQSFDLIRRLSRGFPGLTFHLFHREGLLLPADVEGASNVICVTDGGSLPTGPCVVVANAAKWSWLTAPIDLFDLQIVDEAFQLPDYRFHQIAGLATRHLLVGDPGQIAPVISCEIERWRSDPTGPHVASPKALLTRHPTVRRLQLPVTRRLPADTTRFVQPAFYRDLSFTSLAGAGQRALRLARGQSHELDRVLDHAAAGATLVGAELPEATTGEHDPALAATLAGLAVRLLERHAVAVDGKQQRKLSAADIGIVCAHVTQVAAVRERLPAALSGMLVETADRFQGLEREVMLVQHPLSGRSDATAFQLDAGRLCVMLSRHRQACIVVGRAGIEARLDRHAPSGDRVLGIEGDPEFEGWRAHMTLLRQLREEGRMLAIPTA